MAKQPCGRTHVKLHESQSKSLKESFDLLIKHSETRGSRGAWMRFPDVCAKPVSFNERIAVSYEDPTVGESETVNVTGQIWTHNPGVATSSVLSTKTASCASRWFARMVRQPQLLQTNATTTLTGRNSLAVHRPLRIKKALPIMRRLLL